MDGLQYVNDVITLVILPWLVLIERRLSRMEGTLNIILKAFNGRQNKRDNKRDCRMVG